MRGIATAFCVTVFAGSTFAQLGGLGEQIKIPGIPGLDGFIKKDRPLQYSLNSAEAPVIRLMGFEPDEARQMPEGQQYGSYYNLEPGIYRATFGSFCLRGYTPGPNRGSSYFHKSIEGPVSKYVNKVIDHYSINGSTVDQTTAQTLIWALIARSKPSEVSGEAGQLMQRIFSPQELAALESDGFGILEENVLGPLMSKVDEALAPLYQAENQMRQVVADANRPFAELESLAVLPPTEEGNMPFFEPGMWLHWGPDAFIRFFPNGYSEVEVEYWVPNDVEIWRDQYGRVLGIEDLSTGISVVTDYDDEYVPLVADDPRFVCFMTKGTFALVPNGNGGRIRIELEGGKPIAIFDPWGWTKNLKKEKINLNLDGSFKWSLQDLLVSGDPSPFLQDKALGARELIELRNRQRSAAAKKEMAKDSVSDLKEFKDKIGKDNSDGPDIINYDHYKDGLEAVRNNDPKGKAEFLTNHGKSMIDGLADAIKDIDGLDASDDGKGRKPGDTNPPGERGGNGGGTSTPDGVNPGGVNPGGGGFGGGPKPVGAPGNRPPGTRGKKPSGSRWPFGGGNSGATAPSNTGGQTLGMSNYRK